MINGDILKENQLNENDYAMELLCENVMLKSQLQAVNEAKSVLLSYKELKYAMNKWKTKERALPEVKKDIEKCDKVLKKLDDQLEKYKNAPKSLKVVNNIANIVAMFLPFVQFTQSNMYHQAGFNGLGNRVDLPYMKNKGEVESLWEFYKRDLILCKKETEATKKYLIKLKDKLEKQK